MSFGWTPPLGAFEGPLKYLVPVFVDLETFIDDDVLLSKMTLRQYLARTHVTGLAVAIGQDEPETIEFPDGEVTEKGTATFNVLNDLALNPDYVFVAHNAAFDIRVLRYLCDIPQPTHVWCTMEGAMGAWPDLPGGYGLRECGKTLRLRKKKFQLDLRLLASLRRAIEKSEKGIKWSSITDPLKTEIALILKSANMAAPEIVTDDFLDVILLLYNKRDVETMQELYYRQIPYLRDQEQRIALMTHRVRRNHFRVESSRLDELVSKLNLAAEAAETRAEGFVVDDSDIRQIFNRERDGSLQSIRYRRLKNIIQTKMNAPGIEATSMKKINLSILAQHQDVSKLLEQTGRASKMIYHRRRAEVFRNVDEVDTELGYARAITFRFSSPSVGSGLNLHNVPKRDKEVAKPVRKLFRLPAGLCVVRGDLANVEYRVEGALTGCNTVIKMFEKDINTDPYCEAWRSMTGQIITKEMPIRQVGKSAVLGLGFQMSAAGYARVLLTALASGDVSIVMLQALSAELCWMDPGKNVDYIVKKIGCERIVALAAYHIHKSFQFAHPEFAILADWLVRAVSSISAIEAHADMWDQASMCLDRMRMLPAAPDPTMLFVDVDPDQSFERPSVRVRCGPWVETLCWREPMSRRLTNGRGEEEMIVSIRKSNGMIKPFTRQLAVENVTQAAARNALCYGLLLLEKMGYHDIIHVHDEVMLIVPCTREAVLKAKEDILKVFGPNAQDKPMKWAMLIKAEEITVTQSLYEDDDDIAVTIKNKKTGEVKPGGDRWGKILRNEPGCLDNLP